MTDCDGCVPGARTLDRFWLRARIIRSDFRWRRCQRRREIGLAHDVVRVEKYFVCSAREECAGKGFANACVWSASGGREREEKRDGIRSRMFGAVATWGAGKAVYARECGNHDGCRVDGNESNGGRERRSG